MTPGAASLWLLVIGFPAAVQAVTVMSSTTLYLHQRIKELLPYPLAGNPVLWDLQRGFDQQKIHQWTRTTFCQVEAGQTQTRLKTKEIQANIKIIYFCCTWIQKQQWFLTDVAVMFHSWSVIYQLFFILVRDKSGFNWYLKGWRDSRLTEGWEIKIQSKLLNTD